MSLSAKNKLRYHLSAVDLAPGASVQRAGSVVNWVHFPLSGVVSTTCANAQGAYVEISLTGNEGAVGLIEACSASHSGGDSLVVLRGTAWRAPASLCRTLVQADPEFAETAWRWAGLQLLEIQQSVLCRTTHSVEQYLARWLLECLERSGCANPLPITQEYLSSLLGVQRTTVNRIASQLRSRGMIAYARGAIHVVDRRKLETVACDCRSVTLAHRFTAGDSVAS